MIKDVKDYLDITIATIGLLKELRTIMNITKYYKKHRVKILKKLRNGRIIFWEGVEWVEDRPILRFLILVIFFQIPLTLIYCYFVL